MRILKPRILVVNNLLDSDQICIEKYNKMQKYQNLLFHIYMKLNMFWATHRPSSGA